MKKPHRSNYYKPRDSDDPPPPTNWQWAEWAARSIAVVIVGLAVGLLRLIHAALKWAYGR